MTSYPTLCAHCGEPVDGETLWASAPRYHGSCYLELYPPQDPPGALHRQSWEELVEQGLERR